MDHHNAATSPLSGEDATGRDALQEARRLLASEQPAQARRWAASVVELTDELSTWSAAAKVFEACLSQAPLARRARLAILGSTTTSQLAALLPLACGRAGLQVDVYEAPYGQYRQEILDPGSALYAFGPDVVVIALHDGDVTFPVLDEDLERAVDEALADLHRLWSILTERSRATVVQFTIAVPPEQPLGHLALSTGSRYRSLLELNLRIGASLPEAVVLVDCARLAAEVGARTWFDPRYWHLAKQAMSPGCIPLLARQTGAVIAASLGLSRKCLVLDLDNTLWGGVLGEEGLHGIQLGEGAVGEAFTAFQEHVLALRSKGVVLAVCSKNDEPLVREAFRDHPGMRLTIDDIALVSAGWDDKPAQLRRIAEDLALGLDSLVLVDDNPVEREAVRQLVPEVDVVKLPIDPAGYVRALAEYPYLETVRLTAEDAARTEQYRARGAAAASLAEASSLDEFLASLEMSGSVAPVDPTNLARVAQLVGKTNQFNLTSRRRSQAELESLLDDHDMVVLAARLSDRFADHGLVAVVIGRKDDTDLEIDTWLMSCRVIGRTFEHAILEVLARLAVDHGCTRLRGTYRPTAKNGLVADLLPGLGFEPLGPADDDGSTTWVLSVDDVDVAHHIRMTETVHATRS
jgi:FkbH-like protein